MTDRRRNATRSGQRKTKAIMLNDQPGEKKKGSLNCRGTFKSGLKKTSSSTDTNVAAQSRSTSTSSPGNHVHDAIETTGSLEAPSERYAACNGGFSQADDASMSNLALASENVNKVKRSMEERENEAKR